jgi:5-formyltetrahydrofolate cyclo-ligase
LLDAKRSMRERVLAARDALAPDARERASRAIAHRIDALASFRSAATVLLTFPFRSEWDTRPLIRAALARGQTVALPRVDPAARMLELREVQGLDAMAPGYLGIPEPQEGCAPVAPHMIDWVLVPGVAFDARGRRLGYGGGFYDRLQPLLTRAPLRVAGAYELQIVDVVPAAPHDRGVDLIVTDTRMLDAGTLRT